MCFINLVHGITILEIFLEEKHILILYFPFFAKFLLSHTINLSIVLFKVCYLKHLLLFLNANYIGTCFGLLRKNIDTSEILFNKLNISFCTSTEDQNVIGKIQIERATNKNNNKIFRLVFLSILFKFK